MFDPSDLRAYAEALILLREPLAELVAHLKGDAPEPGFLASMPATLASELALARARVRAGSVGG